MLKFSRPVLTTILALSGVAAFLGLFAGMQGQPTESDVISFAAERYSRETGGALTECVGVPGQDPVWIEVRCGNDSGLRAYRFSRNGSLIDAKQEPQT